MRAILEVRWGRQQGEKLVLEPGHTASVGRTAPADLALPHDRQLSAVHFEVTWDGERATFRDRQSIAGSAVDGLPVSEALLRHGSWIRAGESVFGFYHEHHTPAPDPSDDPPEERAYLHGWQATGLSEARIRSDALATLQRAPETSYAVLDAARSDRILELLRESVERYQSLYEGIGGEKLEAVAPYLVRLPKGTRLLA